MKKAVQEISSKDMTTAPGGIAESNASLSKDEMLIAKNLEYDYLNQFTDLNRLPQNMSRKNISKSAIQRYSRKMQHMVGEDYSYKRKVK